MSIFQFTHGPNGVRIRTYVALPNALDEWVKRWATLFGGTNGGPVYGRARLVASSWPKATNTNGVSGDESGRRYPLLVYCRGGIGRVGRVRKEWIHDFLTRGYIVVAPCYRASEGGEGVDEFGGRENEDVTATVVGFSQLPFVDPASITLLGFSRGSINAVQTASAVDSVSRVVLWGGVSDLSATYKERGNMRRMLRRITGGSPEQNASAYRARSPVHLAEGLRQRVLIVHGTADTQVDVSHGQRMEAKLKASVKPVETHYYVGHGHHLAHDVHQAVVDRICAWIQSSVNETDVIACHS